MMKLMRRRTTATIWEGTLTQGVSQSASLKPESQGVENEASLVQKESKVTA